MGNLRVYKGLPTPLSPSFFLITTVGQHLQPYPPPPNTTIFNSLLSLYSPFTYLLGIDTSLIIYIYIYIYTISLRQARCSPYLTHESLQCPIVLYFVVS